MNKIIKIVEPEDKERGLYRVTFQGKDGETWFGDLTKDDLRHLQLLEKFEKSGYDMTLIKEYGDYKFQEGQDNVYDSLD